MPLVRLGNKGYGNSRDFESWARERARQRKKSFKDTFRKELEKLQLGLIAVTPVDTGAAAGDDTGVLADEPKRELYSSHPAAKMGLDIGHLEGMSGWQIIEEDSNNVTTWKIINPMWELYLKYLEFGTATHTKHIGKIRGVLSKFSSRRR